MHMMRRKKQDCQKDIAKERIGKLFAEAALQFPEYPQLSHRYMVHARRLAERYRVRFTKEQKRSSCKGCNHYLKQGVNARVRLQKGTLVIRCLDCHHLRRMKYK
jgi:ribonuclease P protein subunit RPR2